MRYRQIIWHCIHFSPPIAGGVILKTIHGCPVVKIPLNLPLRSYALCMSRRLFDKLLIFPQQSMIMIESFPETLSSTRPPITPLVLLVLTFCIIAVSGLFTEGNLVCVQARVAGQERHTHLRNNNSEVSDGVHPISVAAAAGRSTSNDRAKCPQQYGKNMSYIINVRDGQDAHYLIANIYSST